ncbi:MAG: sigma-70 family RNA polymerase sigma factor [Verrucomicrobiales bacterium]
MPAPFPTTSLNLLSKLKRADDGGSWEVSWKRFVELYHEPLEVVARACYRHHTGGQHPSWSFMEDSIADAMADFFAKGQHRYDSSRGRLRTYLRVLVNARIVDRLRKERPIDEGALSPATADALPEESQAERESFHRALLATLIEDLRNQIPMRQFEIFERVKLKHQSPPFVAEELGITRAMVDRYVYKAMSKLRTLAEQPEYQEEFND